MNPKIRIQFVILTNLIVLSALGFYFWSKSEFHSTQAIRVAQEFLEHLERQEFLEAYALTVQNNEYVGKTLAAFSNNADRCSSAVFKYTFPFQSNGNRLRRWLAGKEVELLEVSLEFDCPTPYKIVLHRIFGHWKVFNFGAHAG